MVLNKIKEITNKEMLSKLNTLEITKIITNLIGTLGHFSEPGKMYEAKIEEWLDAKYYGWYQDDELDVRILEQGFHRLIN